MSGISRIDSYVTNNLKFPWEKNNDELVFSVGLLEYYEIKKSAPIKFMKKFNISFSVQVICCDYNSESKIFGVGLDNGEVCLYKPTNKQPFYELVFQQKIHGGRVMKLIISDNRSNVYSIGEDGLIQVLSI